MCCALADQYIDDDPYTFCADDGGEASPTEDAVERDAARSGGGQRVSKASLAYSCQPFLLCLAVFEIQRIQGRKKTPQAPKNCKDKLPKTYLSDKVVAYNGIPFLHRKTLTTGGKKKRNYGVELQMIEEQYSLQHVFEWALGEQDGVYVSDELQCAFKVGKVYRSVPQAKAFAAGRAGK